MMKLNFVEDGVQIVLYTGAGPATAKIEYGNEFAELKAVPLEQMQRVGKLIALGVAHLKLQDVHAQAKAAKSEVEETGPKIIQPDRKLVVPE